MPRILLVDDSPTDRQLFSGVLAKEPEFVVAACESGRAALRILENDPTDVVVTDMQMPDMDGLELVRQMRRQHTQVPVILLTGQGSESLAARALKEGAAGYVPKSRSSEMLRETVRHVLELSETAANYERLIGCAALSHFEFDLESDQVLIPPLVELAQQMMGSMHLCDAVDCLQVGVALEHAVINAMFHGNLEQAGPYRPDASNGEGATILSLAENSSHRDRRVHVDMRISREEATFVVRDEGAGFDVKEVSSVGLSTSLDGASGRGMLLMWAFMDQVSFDDAGNTVTLVKRRRVHLPADDADPEKATGPKLPDVLGELVAKSHGKTYQLTKRRLLVGREPSCDIVLNASSVSHHHCVMYLHEGWWYVKDLQSKNGLKVNQKPVTQHLLPPGAMLSVGTVNLEAKYHPDELGSPGMTPPVDPF